MKNFFFTALVLFIVYNCDSDDTCHGDNNITGSTQFVVDKIYDYNNNLLAQYFYNEYNQLVSRKTTINNANAEYEFEYTNNRISSIEYTDYTFPQFSHSISIYYNQQGQIIRDEKYHNANVVEVNDYEYYEDGKIRECARISEDGLNSTYTYIYDIENNIFEVIALLPEFNEAFIPTGNYVEDSYGYEYDSGYKPDFRIGEIFQIEPLPQFGTIATFEKNISLNNMIKSFRDGTEWVYTYNQNNLPETIETIWSGVETEDPLLLRIQYKEIQ